MPLLAAVPLSALAAEQMPDAKAMEQERQKEQCEESAGQNHI